MHVISEPIPPYSLAAQENISNYREKKYYKNDPVITGISSGKKWNRTRSKSQWTC